MRSPVPTFKNQSWKADQVAAHHLFILILQQFDGWYLGPKILGNTVGAKPLSIIFAILIGGSFGGALGMLIAVPLYRSITILWDTFIDNKLIEPDKNWYKETSVIFVNFVLKKCKIYNIIIKSVAMSIWLVL